MLKRLDRGASLHLATLLVLTACAAPPQASSGCASAAALPSALANAEIIIVGEIHGTAETPRFVGDLACALLERGRPVTLGLEMPHDLGADLRAYLDSDGTPSARTQLMQPSHWSRSPNYQDGRASQAMFDLIERVRRIRKAGARIALDGFDLPSTISGTSDEQRRMFAERDRHMAERASALIQPGTTLVLLMGNVHAVRYSDEAPFPANDKMAALMAAHAPVSIAARHRAGSYWGCIPEGCGVQSARGHYSDPSLDGTIRLERRDGYDGFAYLGPVSASPPAHSPPP